MTDWKKSTLWDLFTRANRDEDAVGPEIVEFEQKTVGEEKGPSRKRSLGFRRSSTEVWDDLEAPSTERKSWFSRRRNDTADGDLGVAQPEEESLAEPKTPFWKRSRSLSEVAEEVEAESADGDKKRWFSRRRPEETDGDFQPAELEEETSAEPKTPFWKRDRSAHETEEDAGVDVPAGEKKPWFSWRRKDTDGDFEVAEPEVDTSAEPTTPVWKSNLGLERTEDAVEPNARLEPPPAESEPPFAPRPEGGAGDRDLGVLASEQEPSAGDEAPLSTPDLAAERSTDDVEEDAGVEAKAAERRSWFHRRRDAAAADVDVDERAEDAAVGEGTTPAWTPDATFGRSIDDVEGAAGLEASADEKKPRFFSRRRSEAADRDFGTAEPELEPTEKTTTRFWKRSVGAERVDDGVGVDPGIEEPSGKQKARFFRQGRDSVGGDFELADHEGETKTPFWKRSVGSGRAADEVEEDLGLEAPAPQERKRRFTFRRRQDSVDGDLGVTEQHAEAAPTEEKTPFWKRKLGSGRAADEVDDDFGVEALPEERRPRFSLRRREPSVDGDLAPAPPESEREPFYKREFRLPFVGAAADGAGATSKSDLARGRKKQQLVGLKIGASQIAAARIANNGSPELLQVARQPIESGIVVGGELRDPEALADALRDFFDANDLPNRGVRLGIGNNRIGVRSFEITGLHDPSQLENAIRFRAQEALPIPLDEAVLDYQVIGETLSPTGMRTYRVLLVVAYRELIDRYVAACRGAGLRLAGIDLEAFALLRALLPPSSETLPEDTALVAVSIGHDRSTFAVSNGTVCEFTRVLDWGGAALNTAIARALDITHSEAEPVKRALTLSGADDAAGTSSDDHSARAEEAVRLELQSFARELVSSLHFYQNQPGSLAIGSIVLTGGTAHMPGLGAELQRLTGVKVRVGDPLRRVRGGKRLEAPEQLGSFAVAIGLGIED